MITLEKALSILEDRKKSLIRFVKETSNPPSQQLIEMVELTEISIVLIKKEIEKNGK